MKVLPKKEKSRNDNNSSPPTTTTTQTHHIKKDIFIQLLNVFIAIHHHTIDVDHFIAIKQEEGSGSRIYMLKSSNIKSFFMVNASTLIFIIIF